MDNEFLEEDVKRESENKKLLEKYAGKQIALVELDDSLKIYFNEGSVYLLIYGYGDSCCNDRFMRTDDELNYYSDSIFYRLEERVIEDYEVQIDDENNENTCGEKKFIAIHTSKGEFVISIHNESNGYYTGIDLCVSEEAYK